MLAMAVLIGVLGVFLLLTILWDCFETMILPRRVTRRFRLTRTFYRITGIPRMLIVRRMKSRKAR